MVAAAVLAVDSRADEGDRELRRTERVHVPEVPAGAEVFVGRSWVR